VVVFRLEETLGAVFALLAVALLGLRLVCVGVDPTRPFDPCASTTETEKHISNITRENLLISRNQSFRSDNL
jgi:hypothetical protein